jgi:hypothetical protein
VLAGADQGRAPETTDAAALGAALAGVSLAAGVEGRPAHPAAKSA